MAACRRRAGAGRRRRWAQAAAGLSPAGTPRACGHLVLPCSLWLAAGGGLWCLLPLPATGPCGHSRPLAATRAFSSSCRHGVHLQIALRVDGCRWGHDGAGAGARSGAQSATRATQRSHMATRSNRGPSTFHGSLLCCLFRTSLTNWQDKHTVRARLAPRPPRFDRLATCMAPVAGHPPAGRRSLHCASLSTSITGWQCFPQPPTAALSSDHVS